MKSHVGMEYKICPVTGQKFEIGVLIDKRLKKNLEKENVTGYEFSPEVKEKLEEGYIAIVGTDTNKSVRDKDGTIRPENAYRTGEIVYLKKDVAKKMFNIEVKNMMFADNETISYLEQLYNESIENN